MTIKRFLKEVFVVVLLTSVVGVAALHLTSCKDSVKELPGSIWGTVTDKATGEPVNAAGIELRPSGRKTITGTEGQYEFEDLVAGKYTLSVTRTGYSDVSGIEVVVKSGDKGKYDVQIEKLPQSLRVVGGDGKDIDSLDFGSDNDVNSRTFSIFNDGPASITWYVDKNCVWIDDVKSLIESHGHGGTLEPGKQEPMRVTILRDSLRPGKNTYVLNINSDNGSKELKILATKPITYTPAVNTLEVDNGTITINSATLRGKIISAGQPPYDECGFIYSTNADLDLNINSSGATVWKIKAPIDHSKEIFEAGIVDLNQGVTYYVVAYAKNSIGYAYGNKVSFVTTSETKPQVTTLKPDHILSDGATFNGKILSVGVPPYTERGFVYSTVSMPSHDNNSAVATAPVNDNPEFSAKVIGLSLGNTYYVRAYAKNSLGYSYSTNEEMFKTSSVPPEVSIQDVSDVTVNSAILHGSVDNIGDPAYTERGFCYGKSHNPTFNNTPIWVSGSGVEGEFHTAISGLEINTTYYVRSYVRVNEEPYIYSLDEKEFKTKSSTPATVETMDAISVGTTSAILRGNVTFEGEPPYTERGFCYATTHNPTIYNNPVVADGQETRGEFSKTVNNLLDNTTYYYRAYAKAGNNEPSYGDEKEFTTQENSGSASVSISDYVSMCNAIGFWFNPSYDTKKYYWKLYTQAEANSMSEPMLKADLVSSGREMSQGSYDYDWSSNLTSSTSYVLCVVATDREEKQGPITKMNVNTKSTSGQPVVVINLAQCGQGTAEFSVLMGVTCSSFAMLAITPFDDYMDVEDIVFAMAFHQNNPEQYTSNQFFSTSAPGWMGVIAVGYDASGEMSGLITRKVFNTTSGAVMSKNTPKKSSFTSYHDYSLIERIRSNVRLIVK